MSKNSCKSTSQKPPKKLVIQALFLIFLSASSLGRFAGLKNKIKSNPSPAFYYAVPHFCVF